MLKKLSVGILSCFLILFLWNSQSFAQGFEDDDMVPPPQEDMGQPPHRGMMGQGQGQGGHMMGRGQRGGKEGMRGFFKELNLTEEQKEILKTKRESAKEQIQSLREQMRPEMEKMMDLMHNPDSTKQEVFAQIDKVGKLKIEMHKIRAGNLLELKSILTPEQKTKLQEIVAKKKEQMQQMRGNRQGRGFRKFRGNNNNNNNNNNYNDNN